MTLTRDEKLARFAALHRPGDPLVLWNAWDAGSAAAVARAGAKAVATGSAAVAQAMGFPDGEALPLDLLVAISERVALAAGDLPASIDFEGAYSADPAGAAANALRIARAGAVGINFEDGVVGGEGLHPVEAQAARIAAIVGTCAEAGLPLHVSRGRSSGKIDLIIIDTPANSKDIAMLAAEQADFVIIPVAPRGLDVHSVLQTVKQVQQAGTPFAVILTQVPHQGGEGQEAHAGFAAKGVTMFDSRLHFRKDFYKATPLGRTAAETDPDSKAAAELRAAYGEAKRLSGFTTKQVSEVG